MEKTIKNLAIVLVVQLVLALTLGLSGKSLGTQAPDKPLVTFKSADIDSFSITGGEGGSVTVTKKESQWILPDQKGFPANADQAKGLLESLAGLKHGLPVATTAAAQARFKVANDDFERKIVLSQNGTQKAVLYFGTSPGLRQVHARAEGLESTLSVAFANHQAPVKADEWMDKTILAIPLETIESIEVAGLTVTRHAEPAPDKKGSPETKKEKQVLVDNKTEEIDWKVEPLAAGESPNQEELAKLARSFAHLRVDGFAETGGEVAAALEKPQAELAVKQKNGTRIAFKVAKPEKKDFFLIKSSGREEIFRIVNYTGDLFIKGAKKETLVKSPAKVEEKNTIPEQGRPQSQADQPVVPQQQGGLGITAPTDDKQPQTKNFESGEQPQPQKDR